MYFGRLRRTFAPTTMKAAMSLGGGDMAAWALHVSCSVHGQLLLFLEHEESPMNVRLCWFSYGGCRRTWPAYASAANEARTIPLRSALQPCDAGCDVNGRIIRDRTVLTCCSAGCRLCGFRVMQSYGVVGWSCEQRYVFSITSNSIDTCVRLPYASLLAGVVKDRCKRRVQVVVRISGPPSCESIMKAE